MPFLVQLILLIIAITAILIHKNKEEERIVVKNTCRLECENLDQLFPQIKEIMEDRNCTCGADDDSDIGRE